MIACACLAWWGIPEPKFKYSFKPNSPETLHLNLSIQNAWKTIGACALSKQPSRRRVVSLLIFLFLAELRTLLPCNFTGSIFRRKLYLLNTSERVWPRSASFYLSFDSIKCRHFHHHLASILCCCYEPSIHNGYEQLFILPLLQNRLTLQLKPYSTDLPQG